jgi:hypothetical protein
VAVTEACDSVRDPVFTGAVYVTTFSLTQSIKRLMFG